MENYINGQEIFKIIDVFLEDAKEDLLTLQFEIRDDNENYLGGMNYISPYAVNIDPSACKVTINGFTIPIDSSSIEQWQAMMDGWYYLYLTNNETPEVNYVLIKGE